MPPPAPTCSLLSFTMTLKAQDVRDAPGSVFSQTECSPWQATGVKTAHHSFGMTHQQGEGENTLLLGQGNLSS